MCCWSAYKTPYLEMTPTSSGMFGENYSDTGNGSDVLRQIHGSVFKASDKYANRIPNPEPIPKYTKVKVLHTQDKHLVS